METIELKKNPVIQTVSKEEVKQVEQWHNDSNGAVLKTIYGHPVFNNFDHTLIDLQHLALGTEDWGHTLSVKLPNGHAVTLCVMQCAKTQFCVDVDYYSNGGRTKNKVNALGFKEGRSKFIEDVQLVTVTMDMKVQK